MKMYGERNPESLVGKQLGNYRLTRLLGRGSFAEVYLGEHRHLNRQAAIKILHTHLLASEIQHFEAEARTIARLEHPNIVRVLEGGVDGNVPYLIMEYAPHGTLQQRYIQGQRYAPHVILPHVLQIAAALQYAHQRRIIHRDVKPENVLVGANQEALLSDFGMAVVAHSTRSQKVEAAAGSLYYMAPEVIEGHPRTASDQYALAAIIYTWLSGTPPFVGTFHEIASQHLSIVPMPLSQRVPGLPLHIQNVLQRALLKDPRQRFPDMEMFARALEAACQGKDLPYEAGYRALDESPFSFSPDMQQKPAASEAEETASIEVTTIRPDEVRGRRVSRRAMVGMFAVGAGVVALGGGAAWWIWGRSKVGPLAQTTQPTATRPPTKPFGTQLLVFNGHEIHNDPSNPATYNTISTLAWSPDSKMIASADNKRILVWDTERGTIITEYKGHHEAVNRIGWLNDETVISAGGTKLASTSADQTNHEVHIWQARSGKTTASYASVASTIPVAWSPDGKRILSVKQETIDAQGTTVEPASMLIWDASTGETLVSHQGQSLSGIFDVAWSPDGKYLVSVSSMGSSSGGSSADMYSVKVWKSADGTDIVTDPADAHEGLCVAWQPTGNFIASGHIEGYVRIWEALTGKRVAIFQGGSESSVLALDWSPDGKYIVASTGSFQALGYATDAYVWDLERKRLVGRYKKHANYVRSLKWSPDRTRVASTDGDTIHVWQAE